MTHWISFQAELNLTQHPSCPKKSQLSTKVNKTESRNKLVDHLNTLKTFYLFDGELYTHQKGLINEERFLFEQRFTSAF